jgi:hypothetical protein
MGSIFKKIKRIVKKNPLTKIFKKVGKGIADVGKKTWQGIKRIGGKVMSAYGKISQKLGPIGMIGLSMAMPYLLGGFSGAAGGLWTNFGTGMKTLQASQNPFFKAMGYAGKGMYNTANFIGGTTRGISQTISKTFGQFAQGNVSQGFANLYQGTTEVLSGKAGMGTMKYIDTSAFAKAVGVPGTQTGVKLATQNLGTLVQTGGVNLGNVNIGNKFAYEVINKSMLNNEAFKKLSGEGLKYHNTLVNNVGLDDQTAFQYISNNGYDPMTGVLDKTTSMDFADVGAGKIGWTGKNIDKTVEAYKLQTGGGFQYKIKKDGDIFETQESMLSKKKSWKDAAGAAVKNLFSNDQEETPLYAPNAYEKLSSVHPNYAGTDVTGSADAGFISDDMKKWYLLMNKKMNIAGSK